MNAIVYARYGSPDVLEFQEVEKPVPGEHEILTRICAASVNPYDLHFMTGEPYVVRMMAGLRRPKDTRLGADMSGQVEAVGGKVTQFKPGDAVFGMCKGAFAQYACSSETTVVRKPDHVTFEQAASVPIAALTALQGLRDKGRVQPGQRVVVNGAAGGVGTFAVQIAKAFGAEVTGVCSGRNVEMVRSIGADHVIDYTQGDFTRSGQTYDILFDAVGNHSLAACRRVLKPQGTLVMAGGPSGRWRIGMARGMVALAWSKFSTRKLALFLARPNQSDLTILRDLMDAGKITPVIDRRYHLNEVPEAMRYLAKGHARGKVVIAVE